jgi:hypothetical protein
MIGADAHHVYYPAPETGAQLKDALKSRWAP